MCCIFDFGRPDLCTCFAICGAITFLVLLATPRLLDAVEGRDVRRAGPVTRAGGQPRCPHCGYDVRATPDPAGPTCLRCPECGRATTSGGHIPTNPRRIPESVPASGDTA